jgi:hypothetical protein
VKQEASLYVFRYHICFQDTLGIHYDDLGLYKELLPFIEAKAWRVNELVIFTIHLAEVTEDVIEVLVIDILPQFSNWCNNHVQEIKTSALGKMIDSNMVDLLLDSTPDSSEIMAPRLRKGRLMTPTTVPLMLRTLSHLL